MIYIDVGASKDKDSTDDFCRPWKFRLDSSKYTMYPEETETLLDDGSPFMVESVDEFVC